jgi:hypothetical protein
MDYPGRIIKAGETDTRIVGAITKKLAARGYPTEAGDKAYDARLTALVKLFQSQQVDAAGRPLVMDGRVGPMTWGALFGADVVSTVPPGLAGRALTIAVGEIGVMEDPLGSNRGPKVDLYLASVGLDPGRFWCMAFVHHCFAEAAKADGVANPFPRTGGVLEAWRRAQKSHPATIVTAAAARADPNLIRPGLVFILDHGKGLGHTGFVRTVVGGAFRTVEGNSNPNGSSNGIGVFDMDRRKVTSTELRGFIDFTAA